ncbi:MAG: histidinol dehydrogenase, partial [Bacilli bacterium]|nr:histidinol dehydrogenase [Bacilli bacterium]
MKIVSASEFQIPARSEQIAGSALADVQRIVAAVKELGDQALFDYTAQFDQVELSDLRVPAEHYAEAYEQVSEEFISALSEAM